MEKYNPILDEINPDERKSMDRIREEIPGSSETLYVKTSGEIVDERPQSKCEERLGISPAEREENRIRSIERSRKSLDNIIKEIDSKLKK